MTGGIKLRARNKKFLSKVIGGILVGGLLYTVPDISFAAPLEKQKVDTEVQKSIGALSFNERVQKILDEYHDTLERKNTRFHASNESNEDKNTDDLKEDVLQKEQTQSVIPNAIYDQKYTFDWQGTPVAQSLYAVGKAANKSIVVPAELSGNVYVSLKNVTYTQALDYLSRSFNFNYMIDDGAIIISTSELMKQSQTFYVNYVDKTKIREELVALGIEAANIYANSATGTISVTGTPYQLQEAAKRIKIIDNPVSQCLVVAQLIEVTHGKNLNLGLQYSLPTYSHEGSSDAGTLKGNFLEKLTFSASSDASKALSNGKVIARPMVMMFNGEVGNVMFGDKVPVLTSTSTTASTTVTVDYQEIGTSLKVTPTINEKTSEISMKIEAEVSNISKWVTQGEIKAPQISKRQAITSAHIKSGKSFVIGGLMSVNELDNLSGIPGLMDLPILGKIFSYHSESKSYSEIFIMITPYIVTDNIDPKQILKKVGE